jgi:kynurenine formamidase
MEMRWKNRPAGSNWGEFGPDDQRGRMNLLTPARRLNGIREVEHGIAFTLSLPLDYPGGSELEPLRKPPQRFVDRLPDGKSPFNYEVGAPERTVKEIMCDDGVVLYTQYSTQWDSLAHWGQLFDADGDGVPEKVYYNGYRAGEHIVGPELHGGPCARALGIENLATAGVQGRGTLVSLKAEFGTGRSWINYDQLMQAIESQRVDVQQGDFLLLHVGFDEALLSMKGHPDVASLNKTGAVLDGRDERLLRWIDESGIVAVCSDNQAVEGWDLLNTPIDHPVLPLHELCLFKLGIHLGELWYLDELANWLLANRRSSFLLTAPPLRLPGSVGSPVTGIATV